VKVAEALQVEHRHYLTARITDLLSRRYCPEAYLLRAMLGAPK